MSNTGIKYATIAYKVDADGDPLDLSGAKCSETGQKQAIRLRTGFDNPNPSQYDVEGYFSGMLAGEQTSSMDVGACPIGGLSAWVLDGGHWHNFAHWYKNRIWTY